MTVAAGDAHGDRAIYGARHRIIFPIFDGTGSLVTGAAGLDSERSLDQGTFADCANEAVEIATASGMYYLDLTATETQAKAVAVIVKTSTAGAKTSPKVIPVDRLPILRSGTAQAGAATTITLDASASAKDGAYVGLFVQCSNNSPANVQGQTRKIISYNGGTKVATVEAAWGTNPSSATTFDILVPLTVNLAGLLAQELGQYAATLQLKAIDVENNAGDAIRAASTGGSGDGIHASGNGSGSGFRGDGGATGHGFNGQGGATSGHGFLGQATGAASHGFRGTGAGTGAGASFLGGGTAGPGLEVTGNGDGDGFKATGNGLGHGANLRGGTTGGDGLSATAQAANGRGANFAGFGTGPGLRTKGGATGPGTYMEGGNTSGAGFFPASIAGPAINVEGATDGINIVGSDGRGIVVLAAGAGSYAALDLQGNNGGAGILAKGGDTGHGFHSQGGATAGDGARVQALSPSDHGLNAISVLGVGIRGTGLTGIGGYAVTEGVGFEAVGGDAGDSPAGPGVRFTGGNALAAQPAAAGFEVQGGAATTTGGGLAGPGFKVQGGAGAATTNGAGLGFQLDAGADAGAGGNSAARFSASGDGSGLLLLGSGDGHGQQAVGGATGHGMAAFGGATSGDGFHAEALVSGHGMNLLAAGATKHGFLATGSPGGGVNDGARFVAGAGGVDVRGNLTGNVTGSVSGSVGSVAAGGITAASIATDAIDGDAIAPSAVSEIQAGLALDATVAKEATLNIVAGYVDTEVQAILNRLGGFTGAGDNTVLGFLRAIMREDVAAPSDVGGTYDPATDSLEAAANSSPNISIHSGTAQGPGTGNNQIQLDVGASAVDGHYDPAMVVIVAGTGAGQTRLILQYNGFTRTATVDRDWKTNPDATSQFQILSHPGREHVNEGLAGGGTNTTIILNANASTADDAYNGQLVFLRSGTGQDQVALVTDYNGTTQTATIRTAGPTGEWSVNPDGTTGYVVLPFSLAFVIGMLPSGLDDVTIPEPGGVFTWPATIRQILGWLGAKTSNKVIDTGAGGVPANQQRLRNRADSATIAAAPLGVSATESTRGTFT